MIPASPWMFYFYILNIRNVIGVRIFQNVLPAPMPTKFVEFVPEVISNTCMLKPENGPCRANIEMYYYSPEIGNCTTFTWGGCQGNGNRFDTRGECLQKCLSKQDGPKRRPRWCALTFDYGFCFGASHRWYFDNLWKVCKSTIYSGCGGNRNNFYSHAQCESVCLYGNGPLVDENKHVTAPTKVLIVNPTDEAQRSRPNRKGQNERGNGNGEGNQNDDGKGGDDKGGAEPGGGADIGANLIENTDGANIQQAGNMNVPR